MEENVGRHALGSIAPVVVAVLGRRLS